VPGGTGGLSALHMNAEILVFQRQRGAGDVQTSKRLFNDNYALIRLGRLTETGELLHACRDVFEEERDYGLPARTYSALADLEDEQHHREAAVSLERIALEYKYQALQPEACAISYNNLTGYFVRYGGQFEHRERAATRLMFLVPLALSLIFVLLNIN